MLMAALVAAVLGLVMTVASSQHLDRSVHAWGPVFAWLLTTSVIASWTILFFSKLWEGSTGDHALRRFCLMVAGMVVGTLASVVAHSLALEPTYLLGPWREFEQSLGSGIPELYGVTGEPHVLAYAGLLRRAVCHASLVAWRRSSALGAVEHTCNGVCDRRCHALVLCVTHTTRIHGGRDNRRRRTVVVALDSSEEAT